MYVSPYFFFHVSVFYSCAQGIPGMILAVPLIVIARIVCDHLDHPYAKTLKSLLEGNVFEVQFSWLAPREIPLLACGVFDNVSCCTVKWNWCDAFVVRSLSRADVVW